jgi:Zn-dependent metalloprotease
MFYLLAEGGTSKCNGNKLTGIGRTAAAKIWYTGVRDYMNSGDNYSNARVACLAAAAALYGSHSPQRSAVHAAFAAINVN